MLSDFLKTKLAGKRGEQAALARALGRADATVSRWAAEKKQRNLTFDNCLRVARHFRTDPVEVFQAIGKNDWVSLYRGFFPEYQQESKLTAADLYPLRDDAHYHEALQRILECGSEYRVTGIKSNIDAFNEAIASSPPQLKKEKMPRHAKAS